MNAKQTQAQQAAGITKLDVTASRTAGGRSHDDIGKWLSIEEALRVNAAQLRRRSAQQTAIQENERRRIAMELHDGLGQTLSLAKLTLQEAARSVNSGAMLNLGNTLERATSQIKLALDEMRRIAMNLRPSTLDDLGIVATMSWYVRELESIYPNVMFDCKISASEADVSEPLKITIFRIVQEATGNALKHAEAERLEIRLTHVEGILHLSIEDNGKGFDPKNVEEHRDFIHGIGLQSMKERAELSGGSYEIQSSPGAGTRIGIKWLRVRAPGTECPVIPMDRTLAQSLCKSSPNPVLAKHFSACLDCLRTSDSN